MIIITEEEEIISYKTEFIEKHSGFVLCLRRLLGLLR